MKNASVYPLKMSQPLGGALACLGINKTIPIHHGSQGCTSFSVAMLTRHFREIVPIQTTALSEIATIVGDDINLHEAIKNVISSRNPEMVVILSTGVSETRGDDVKGGLKRFRVKYKDYDNIPILFVSTPDFKGSLEDGFIATINEIIENIPEKKDKIKGQVNVILSPFLTAGDIDEIREIIESFGLKPIILPDLSETMSGVIDHFITIPEGGTTLEDIKNMGASEFSIAVGFGARAAVKILYEKFGIPFYAFDSLMKIEDVDRFFQTLSLNTGKSIPKKYIKQRKQLVDLMLDTHFYYINKSISIALEPSHIFNIYAFIKDNLGINIETVVSPSKSDILQNIGAEQIIVGDLEDLKNNISKSLIIFSNSHAYHMAKENHCHLIRIGIPVFEEFGHFLKTYVSYKGAINILSQVASIFFEHDEEDSYEPSPQSHQFL